MSNDTVIGDAGNDLLDGGAGNDTIDYSGVGETDMTVNLATGIATGLGTDTLAASAGDGNSFENVLTGGGDDTITGDSDANNLNAGAGDNSVSGSTGNDTLTTGAGDDFLDGGAGNDVMNGGGGDDFYLETPGSADAINDTGGYDVVSFEDATRAVTYNFTTPGVVQTVDSAGNTLIHTGTIEEVLGSEFGDNFTGMDMTYVPQDGNDRITDTGTGGTIDYSEDTTIFGGGKVSGTLPKDGKTSRFNDGFGDKDTISGINNLIVFGDGDRVRGNDNANTIIALNAGNRLSIDGRGGDDIIEVFNDGLATNVVIRGGNGNDDIDVDGFFNNSRIDGGRDDDSLFIDIAGERNRVTGGSHNDSIVIFDLFGPGNRVDGGAGHDFIDGVLAGSGLDLRGGSGHDTLMGSAFNDILNGGAGNDHFNGLGGSNEQFGGAGNDVFNLGTVGAFDIVNGGSGSRDTLNFFNAFVGAEGVYVDLIEGNFFTEGDNGGSDGGSDGESDLFSGEVKAVEDVIGSPGHDFIRGNNSRNFLSGGSGEDLVLGQGGNDTVAGGDDDDSLDGGKGKDEVFGGDTDDDEGGSDGDADDGFDQGVHDPADKKYVGIDQNVASFPLPEEFPPVN